MSTYRAWYLSLASSLLVASPWAVQAQSQAPVKMVFAVWHDTTGAEAAVKRMSTSSKDHIEAYAVLIKDPAGKVDTRLRHHRGNSVTGVQSSQTVDSAIARLSSPSDSAQAYAVSSGNSPLVGRGSEESHGDVRCQRIGAGCRDVKAECRGDHTYPGNGGLRSPRGRRVGGEAVAGRRAAPGQELR